MWVSQELEQRALGTNSSNVQVLPSLCGICGVTRTLNEPRSKSVSGYIFIQVCSEFQGYWQPALSPGVWSRPRPPNPRNRIIWGCLGPSPQRIWSGFIQHPCPAKPSSSNSLHLSLSPLSVTYLAAPCEFRPCVGPQCHLLANVSHAGHDSKRRTHWQH